MNSNLIKQTVKAYDIIAASYSNCWLDDNCMENSINIFTCYLSERRSIEKAWVLDVGCGIGRDFLSLKNKGILNVIGIDLSKEMLNEAKKHIPEGKFELMDMRKISYEPCKFDGIWANASLLHIPRKEIEIVLNNFYKILKPNGIIFISLQKLREGKNETVDPDGRLFVRYKFDEVKNLLVQHNFKEKSAKQNIKSDKNTYNMENLIIEWMHFYYIK